MVCHNKGLIIGMKGTDPSGLSPLFLKGFGWTSSIEVARSMKISLLSAFLILCLFPPSTAQETLSFSSALEQITSAYNVIANYHCRTNTFERAGNKTDEKVFDYYFMKPSCVHVEILEGRNKGSTATLKDGRVKAAMGGIFKSIKVFFRPKDKIMLSIRGGSLDRSGWGNSIETIKEQLKQGWKTKIEEIDNNTWLMELSSAPASSDYLQRYYVNPETKLFNASEYYENGALVESVNYEVISLNSESNTIYFNNKGD